MLIKSISEKLIHLQHCRQLLQDYIGYMSSKQEDLESSNIIITIIIILKV